MEGTIVNQIEISGFEDEKSSDKFRKKLKSLKSRFNLKSFDKSMSFSAEEASWKSKEDHSLIYLFLTEDSHPDKEIARLAELNPLLEIQHLIISPAGCGEILLRQYKGETLKEETFSGSLAHMLGDLIQGGFRP